MYLHSDFTHYARRGWRLGTEVKVLKFESAMMCTNNVVFMNPRIMLHRISTRFLVFHVYSYQLNIRCSLHKSLSLDSLAHGFSLTSYDIYENVQSFGARTPDT